MTPEEQKNCVGKVFYVSQKAVRVSCFHDWIPGFYIITGLDFRFDKAVLLLDRTCHLVDRNFFYVQGDYEHLNSKYGSDTLMIL